MTTFQAIVYAMIEGVSQFLPISSKAHQILVPYLLGWQAPTGAMLGALSLGSLLALFIYFRHDWASMISCTLQIIIYRRRPMTLDERLPLFVALGAIPSALIAYYFRSKLADFEWTPLWVAGVLAAISVPLWGFEYMSRKIKSMFDWNWIDALIVGMTQSLAVLPGCDLLTGALLGAFFLNYKREPAVKYAYFAMMPFLVSQTINDLEGFTFHAPSPMPDVSWLSFGVAFIISLLVGLLSIGGFMKHIQQKGLGQYVIYRWVLAAGIVLVHWYRNR